MAELPRGTVTLVFSDIEGSTRLLEVLGERYGEVLAEHRKLLREAFSACGGVEVDTQGDALFFAFSHAKGAVLAAAEAQRALASHSWAQGVSVAVRMGVHTGEPALGDEGYVGADVHRAARICSAAHGGQVVVSEVTARLVGDGVGGVELRDLGVHGLKDLSSPQHLYQLVIEGLRQDFPAIRTLEGRPTNLPRQLTPLLGREEEIREGCELVAQEDVALVTFTGPGGTGKTRLALRIGVALIDSFRDGVFFVDLSAITDADLVTATIAQALSLRESSGQRIEQVLKDYVATKELLLILDNFEQVMAASASVSSLLSTSPKLKLVITSREGLRVAGERELPVPPLKLPPGDATEAEQIAASPAVALFVERARAAKPAFELTQDNTSVVAEICRRLDGLPLAIELAAARIKLLSPAALLSRLSERLKVLTGGRRDAAARQQTLRGAIEWSYELLDADEKKFFYRLAVFAGGFSVDAPEGVCDQGDLSVEVFDLLASLVDKSLVRVVETAEGRFTMLETIREYATERLEATGEAEEIRRHHAGYFRGLAEEAEPHLITEDQKEWLDRLDREHDNLRAALDWAIEKDTECAASIATRIWRFWWIRGNLREGRLRLERVLAA